jgi:hypothetical protein
MDIARSALPIEAFDAQDRLIQTAKGQNSGRSPAWLLILSDTVVFDERFIFAGHSHTR